MLSAEDNELVCRVGPGTPMGELMRRHWIPALASTDLVADGEPVRLMLLGEKLIAFRDTNGKVGILDHECPHRLASLFYGRNEEGGLRCIYHGWKFDTEGNCLDMANVPPHQDFKANVKAPAYKVQERGGVIWTYMGPGAAPELPAILANLIPAEEAQVNTFLRDSNWLQALEGDIDTSHAGFLHGGMNGVAHGKGLRKVPTESVDDPVHYDPLRYGYTEIPYEFEGSEMPWGTMYGAYRPADDTRNYWRLAQVILPFWTITPTSPIAERVSLRAWVPLDDTHTRTFSIGRKNPNFTLTGAIGSARGPGIQAQHTVPDTTGWYGKGRITATMDNDYLIDRAAQKTHLYSGIIGVTQQDQCVTESMGPIANRTKEHLAVSDRMIQVTRRRLIDAVVALRDRGELPETVTNAAMYSTITGGYFLAPKGKSLFTVYDEQQAEFKARQAKQLKSAAE